VAHFADSPAFLPKGLLRGTPALAYEIVRFCLVPFVGLAAFNHVDSGSDAFSVRDAPVALCRITMCTQ